MFNIKQVNNLMSNVKKMRKKTRFSDLQELLSFTDLQEFRLTDLQELLS